MMRVRFYLHIDNESSLKYGIKAVCDDGEIFCCKNLFAGRRNASSFVDLMGQQDVRWDVVMQYLDSGTERTT